MNDGRPGAQVINMIGDATGLTIPAVFATTRDRTQPCEHPGATVTVDGGLRRR